MTDLYLRTPNTLECDGKTYTCAIGKSGLAGVGEKREGDGQTPHGVYALRHFFYRADRFDAAPVCDLPTTAITPEMGWCDSPEHPLYNQLVTLPFEASHEKMWRDDPLYDAVVVIGYNDTPPTSWVGSAIFIHQAKEGYAGTEGCIALAREDLLEILPKLSPQSRIFLEVA